MIEIQECEVPVDFCLLEETDKLTLNTRFTEDWRVRAVVAKKLYAAAEALPDGFKLVVFEAFRSRERQQQLWDEVYAQVQTENPDWKAEELYAEASRWVSPPDGLGSGHQAGAAVDVSLLDAHGNELDMGTPMQVFNENTPFAVQLDETINVNRKLLCQAMEEAGLINYPDEWWHYSYGDRLWAEVTGRTKAFFAPVE